MSKRKVLTIQQFALRLNPDGESLGTVVDRIILSVKGSTEGDRGYQKKCTVSTRDLMTVASAMVAAGPAFLSQRVQLVSIRDGKKEDVTE